MVAVCGLLALAAMPAQAQRRKAKLDPEKMAQKRAEAMKAELGLNDQQVAQVKQIQQESAQKQVANWKAFKEERRKFMLQARKVRYENHARIYAVLTPEQQKKFDQMVIDKLDKRIKQERPAKPAPEGGK